MTVVTLDRVKSKYDVILHDSYLVEHAAVRPIYRFFSRGQAGRGDHLCNVPTAGMLPRGPAASIHGIFWTMAADTLLADLEGINNHFWWEFELQQKVLFYMPFVFVNTGQGLVSESLAVAGASQFNRNGEPELNARGLGNFTAPIRLVGEQQFSVNLHCYDTALAIIAITADVKIICNLVVEYWNSLV